MPSALVNTTLSGLNMGVTQQYQEGRYDSQVNRMMNCMPTLTRGVLRRNPLEAVSFLEGLTGGDLNDAYVYSYDRGTGIEQYIIVIPGDGTINTYNANTGTLLSKASKAYLQAPLGTRAKDIFKAITLGDHTFIVNSTVTTSMHPTKASTHGYSNMAFYWIKKTASVTTNQYQTAPGSGGTEPIETGSRQVGYKYTLNNIKISGTTDTRPTYTQVDLNTADKIAEEFTRYFSNSQAPSYDGAICYNAGVYPITNWKWGDTFGNEASLGVWTDLDNSDDLPANLPIALDKFQVRVSGGTSAEFDDYFLQYNYDRKSWKEVVAPGALTTINPDTMPHVLYRLTSGFVFDTYKEVSDDGSTLGDSAWNERQVGGENSIDDPSFLGKTISNIFFYKNRLGILTQDSVVLSQTGAYGNYFAQTLQEVLDDDPIDLAIASTDVTILRHAVPTAGQLILFSDDTQFSLSSTEGALTPKSADITALSSYTYGASAPAVAIGNRILFANQAGGYSHLYSYGITDQGSRLSEANPLSLHLPSYIDESLSRITGHDVLGYTFLETEEYPKQLIVLTSVSKNNQELQNAFHRWTFKKNLVSSHIINNDLYVVFSDGSLCKMTLEVPGDIRLVNYLDEYPDIGIGPYPFTSLIQFSKFLYRAADGKGTVRGRYQIKTIQYTLEDYSKYLTIVANTANLLEDLTAMGPSWDDTLLWDDSINWGEGNVYYTRSYLNDDKVTIMTDSKNLELILTNSPAEPSEGFEIATVNVEALFSQRSRMR